MGFNLSSFLGGAASGGSKRLAEINVNRQRNKETAEERQWQIATEERADVRAKKAARAAQKRESEGLIGTMVALGMPLDAAREVAKNGKGAIKVAINDLEYGRENGKDVSGLYTMQNKGIITGDDVANSAKSPVLSIDREAISNMYGPVPVVYDNHNDQILSISNKQLTLDINNPDDKTEYDRLETQRQKLYKDLSDIAGSKDTSGGDDSRKFSEGTVRASIQSELNKQLQFVGMSYDMKKQVIVGLQGDQMGANIAGLNTARNVRKSSASLNDPYMNDSINTLLDDSLKNIQLAADTRMREFQQATKNATDRNLTAPKSPITTFNTVPTQETSKQLEVGDIIKYPETLSDGTKTGAFSYRVYTGTNDQYNYVELYINELMGQ